MHHWSFQTTISFSNRQKALRRWWQTQQQAFPYASARFYDIRPTFIRNHFQYCCKNGQEQTLNSQLILRKPIFMLTFSFSLAVLFIDVYHFLMTVIVLEVATEASEQPSSKQIDATRCPGKEILESCFHFSWNICFRKRWDDLVIRNPSASMQPCVKIF